MAVQFHKSSRKNSDNFNCCYLLLLLHKVRLTVWNLDLNKATGQERQDIYILYYNRLYIQSPVCGHSQYIVVCFNTGKVYRDFSRQQSTFSAAEHRMVKNDGEELSSVLKSDAKGS